MIHLKIHFFLKKFILLFFLFISPTGCFFFPGSEPKLPSGSLQYITSWQNTGGIIGESQRILLIGPSTRIVDYKILNKSDQSQSFLFGQQPFGTYEIDIQLYDGPDGLGNIIGEIRTPIQIGPSTSFFYTLTGATPKQLKTIASPTVSTAGESTQLYAIGLSTSGTPTFLEPGKTIWTSINNINQISPNGIAFSQNPGTAIAQANYPLLSFSQQVSYQVMPFQLQKTAWTVHVFLNAVSDLQPFSTLNIEDILRVATNSEVRFIIQWKQNPAVVPGSTFNGTRRYLIQANTSGTPTIRLIEDLGTATNMGSAQTLNDFLNYSFARYPSQRTLGIMWSHGKGWKRSSKFGHITRSFSEDVIGGIDYSIQTWELPLALAGHHFDLFAWDASLMQMIEVAYELRNSTRYVIGSEESPPASGYPYQLVFKPFMNNPNAPSDTLASSFVSAMLNYTPYATRKITQSVIDTTLLPPLAPAIQQLTTALVNNLPLVTNATLQTRLQAQAYGQNIGAYYYDFVDLSAKMQSFGVPPEVTSAFNNATSILQNAIVFEGHNSLSPGSHGASIDFSPSSVFAGLLTDYQRLLFDQDSNWSNWLQVAP